MSLRAGDNVMGPRPVVIAHRGASGHRPEHTLAAYELAIEQGADFIEPDLVMTKDGVLVARHENAVAILGPDGALREATTDVHERPEFAGRLATKIIDGRSITGWFTEDFTLAELRTLRARERLPHLRPGNTSYDGRFAVPTLAEVVALARRRSAELGREIGVYPELKHPSHFGGAAEALGVAPMEDTLLAELHAAYGDRRGAPVFIQCFEPGTLVALRGRTRLRLVLLAEAGGRPHDFAAAGDARSYADLLTPAGLVEVARYADGIGVDKSLLIPRDGVSGALGAPTTLARDAHAAGLLVHAWTFRAENHFLPADFRRGDEPAGHGDLAGELKRFLALGIDGVFCDFPEVAVGVVRGR